MSSSLLLSSSLSLLLVNWPHSSSPATAGRPADGQNMFYITHKYPAAPYLLPLEVNIRPLPSSILFLPRLVLSLGSG